MMDLRVAYCTGFWCTNIGNGFFSLGVEHVLKYILGSENVTVVGDLQTYTTGYGKRLWPHKNQLEYISRLDVDYVVLAGPVLSRYFLPLWADILRALKKRGVGYILLSAGEMKINAEERNAITDFMKECPPYILCSRETKVYDCYGKFARHAYDGVCFAFFAPDYYAPCGIQTDEAYWVMNFDKIIEPRFSVGTDPKADIRFEFGGTTLSARVAGASKRSAKTDRFTDALIYARSMLPRRPGPETFNGHPVFRADQRFHPHYRGKIYASPNTYCADIPYGYLNLYANAELTLSDRIHACAVTLAYGHSAMLFAETNRVGLLERVGAGDIRKHPVSIDQSMLAREKSDMVEWLESRFERSGK